MQSNKLQAGSVALPHAPRWVAGHHGSARPCRGSNRIGVEWNQVALITLCNRLRSDKIRFRVTQTREEERTVL